MLLVVFVAWLVGMATLTVWLQNADPGAAETTATATTSATTEHVPTSHATPNSTTSDDTSSGGAAAGLDRSQQRAPATSDMDAADAAAVCSNKTGQQAALEAAATPDSGADDSVDPCRNLALHVTGNWLREASDGEDRSFSLMERDNAETLFDIFEIEHRRSWGRGGAGILHRYMRACEASHAASEAAAEASAAASVLCERGAEILRAPNSSVLVGTMGKMSREGAVVPFYFTVETDRRVGRKPVLYFEQDGVLASDDRVFSSDRAKASHVEELKRVLRVFRTVCGDTVPAAAAVDVAAFGEQAHSVERELHLSHERSAAQDVVGYVLHTGEYERDVLPMREARTLLGPAFSFAEFARGFMPENAEWVRRAEGAEVWLYRKAFFERFARVWADSRNLRRWRAYLLCALVVSQMRYMPLFFPEVRASISREMLHGGVRQEMFQPLLRADGQKLHAVSGGGARARSYATPWRRSSHQHTTTKHVAASSSPTTRGPHRLLARESAKSAAVVPRFARDGGTAGAGGAVTGEPLPECLWHTWQHVSPQVARWFAQVRAPDFVRAQIRTIVEDVRDAMVSLLRTASGLAPANVEKQIRKLDAMVIKIGTPNNGFPAKLDEVEVSDASFQRNAVEMDRWHRATQTASLLADTVPRDGPFVESTSLTETNAFYNPQENCISVLAGLFLPPFYSPRYDDTRLMAGIGMVVGHELAHSVDYTGVYWNEHGSLDAAFATDEFVAETWHRTACVRDQYTDFTRLGNVQDGTVTVAEDWSDVFGTKAALEVAIRRANLTDSAADAPRRRALVREFFEHYARNWMVAYTRQSERAVIRNDVHSVAEVRINNVFANSARGLRAFGCRGTPVCPNVP